MPSTKGGGQGSQLRIPSAPKLDRYGLHDPGCECGRCTLGFRPSPRDRWAARQAFERAAEVKAKAAAAAAKETTAEVKAGATWARLERAEAETRRMLRDLAAPVVRPATAEELAELKREYGFKPRGKR